MIAHSRLSLSSVLAAVAMLTIADAAYVQAVAWTAIAADGKGRWGYGHNYRTSGAARAAAVRSCGGSGCNVEGVAQNRCLAYAESRRGGYWYGTSIGPTQNAVVRGARGGCALGAPAGSCNIVKAVC